MDQQGYGYKRRVVGAHYGTMDFIAQRVTGVIMAVYTVVLLVGFLFMGELNYENWRNLFAFTCLGLPVGQMLATVAFLSVIWHAWVGVRDIWMDYVRADGLRLFLQVLTLLWLLGTVAFFAKILWSL
ncbi:succinate dehydrogenase, hydrophobic membrane anchor protein [Achromobacter sp. F4_2707]|uniref:succinate dehydrogenase, hydrophobic membrane anchor protein n=1 Tax=Achromobacter sp. F4_2707 TaxID=3114286 RepID=UPI0039C6CB27